MKVLVSAFDPFNQEVTNASQLVLTELAKHDHVIPVVLPTSFHRSFPLLRQAIASYQPDIVLMLGEAGGRTHIQIERVAINLDDARIADNDGVQLIQQPIEPNGPVGIFTRLPYTKVLPELIAAGHAISLSNSAGNFVCNHLFYEAVYRLPKTLPVGFIHLPLLSEQARTETPAFAREQIVQSMVALIDALIASV
jgi:Pyrrolidone-carboxylate peptidase (N-terminal pyroglutamyl peptidase)